MPIESALGFDSWILSHCTLPMKEPSEVGIDSESAHVPLVDIGLRQFMHLTIYSS